MHPRRKMNTPPVLPSFPVSPPLCIYLSKRITSSEESERISHFQNGCRGVQMDLDFHTRERWERWGGDTLDICKWIWYALIWNAQENYLILETPWNYHRPYLYIMEYNKGSGILKESSRMFQWCHFQKWSHGIQMNLGYLSRLLIKTKVCPKEYIHR